MTLNTYTGEQALVLLMMGKLRINSSMSKSDCTMKSLNLKMKKMSDPLLALIVCTGLTSAISVVSRMSTIPTVTTIRSLIPHTFTPVK